MSYDWNFDPTTDTLILQEWAFRYEFYMALKERHWALGRRYWPECIPPFAEGLIITDVTPTSLSFSGTLGHIGNKINGIYEPQEYLRPGKWHGILWPDNHQNPHRILRVMLDSWDGANTLTIAHLDNWRLKYGPGGLEQFVGKELAVVLPGPTTWPFWHERVPDRPADFPLAVGRIVAQDAESTELITVATTWPGSGNWEEVVIAGQRYAIASRDGGVLTVPGLPVVSIGETVIVLEAASYWTTKTPDAFPWYTGTMDSMHTIAPNGTYRGTPSSAYRPKMTYNHTTEFGTIQYTLMDNDLWIPYSADFPDPMRSVNPNVTKSVRWLQAAVESTFGAFVKDMDYNGTKGFQSLAVQGFIDAGISGSHIGLSVTVQTYSPQGVPLIAIGTCPRPGWWTPLMAAEMRWKVVCDNLNGVAASATMTSDWSDETWSFTIEVKNNGLIYNHPEFQAYLSYSLYASPGWSRSEAAVLKYLYPKTCLLPAVEMVEGNWVVHQPTDQTGKTGGFWTRPKSSTYTVGGGFEDGHVARYVGDSLHDPPEAPFSHEADSPDNEYRDKFYTGRPLGWSSPNVVAGTATAGDTFYLEDGTANWWYEGVQLEHTALAASGTTTSVTVKDKASSAFWSEPDMFDTPRFEGMIVEIGLVVDGETVWYPRVVRIHDLGTQTLSWNEPLPAAVVGDTHVRIREPRYELNRWQGRKLEVTVGNVVHVREILYSDDRRLFWDNPLPLSTAGAAYRIIEEMPGGTYLRRAGEWIKPPTNDNDPRSGRAFPGDQSAIAPTRLYRWGCVSMWTYVDGSVFAAMRDAINICTATVGSGSWSPYSDAEHTTIPQIPHVGLEPLSAGSASVHYDGFAGTNYDELGAAQAALGSIEPSYVEPTEYGPYIPMGEPSSSSGKGISPNAGWHRECGFESNPDTYRWGVLGVMAYQSRDRGAGYPHLTGSTVALAHLAGSSVFYAKPMRDPSTRNDKNSRYGLFLAPEDTFYSLGGGGGIHWHGGQVLPPFFAYVNPSLDGIPSGTHTAEEDFDAVWGDESATITWKADAHVVWQWAMPHGPVEA